MLGADFFWFSVTVFIVHELFVWDSLAFQRPPLFSLSWICLISRRQNGGSSPSDARRSRVGFLGGHCSAWRAYFKELLVVFAWVWPCFSPRTLNFLAFRILLRWFLIFQRSLPTPDFPKNALLHLFQHSIWSFTRIAAWKRPRSLTVGPVGAGMKEYIGWTFSG